jgi:hypothetical protein
MDPDGIDAITSWVRTLHEGGSPRSLWTALDDGLRLALAQGWVLYALGEPNDDVAEDLADEDTDNAQFPLMLGQFANRWRSVYAILKGQFGVLEQSYLVGVDMELVVLTGPEHIGPIRADVSLPAHCFIIRFENDEWKIAALARRLPVPGWPPAEQDASAFETADPGSRHH